MKNQNKYVITVGDHPDFDDWKYTASKDKAEELAHRFASDNPNTQVDLCEWNEDTNGWDYVSGYMTCKFG